MKWVTHQAGALAAALTLKADPTLSAGLVFGAVLPDLAEHLLSRGDKSLFLRIHRGFLHWFGLYLALLVLVQGLSLPPTTLLALDGLLLGACSHLLLDALNPSGIPLFPFSRNPRLRLPLVSTGSLGEWCFLAGLLLLISLGGYRLDPSWLRRLENMLWSVLSLG
ncbi:MAG: metal-dependent hydrolase [Deltaproteobacteria bacterium]|nr:metal-dependent hydrolase [Deltaproteobacteria bacterium]